MMSPDWEDMDAFAQLQEARIQRLQKEKEELLAILTELKDMAMRAKEIPDVRMFWEYVRYYMDADLEKFKE